MNMRPKMVEELAPMEPLSFRSCQSKSPWQRLFAWIDFERRDLWVLFAYATAVGVFTLATPLAVQSLFNTVAFGQLLQPLFVLALIVFVALGIAAFLNALQLLIVEHIGRRIFLRTAMDFGARLPLVRSRLDGKDLDELSNRFLDVVVVEKSMSQIILDGLSAVLQITVGLILLAVYHPYLLAFDLVLIASVMFVVFVLGRNAVSTAIKESKGKYLLFAWLQDVAKNSHSFRSMRGGEYVGSRTANLANEWLGHRKKHWRVQFRQLTSMLTIQVVATTLLLALGGWLVVERQLSLGQLVAAELMITLTVGSLAKIGKLFPKLYDLIAALDKIGTVLDLDAPMLEGDELELGERGIGLELKVADFDLHLAQGEKRIICATENPHALSVVDGIGSPWTQSRGAVRLDEVD
ncbi:MAG: ABC transporter transmembrane domain-containing protein, partial [Myxococcota bacterium]